MSKKAGDAEKIIARTNDLARHLQENEVPILLVPAFWDTGPEQSRTACDVIVTNQRIFGYYYRQFPREHLFLDAVNIAKIKTATLREKDFEPIFREIRINDGERTVYVRAPRQKCEALYKALREALAVLESGNVQSESIGEHVEEPPSSTAESSSENAVNTVVYERQQIHREFNTSPLAVWLLFVGGVILEVIGALLWSSTQSIATGLPLFFAGFVAVAVGFMVRRQAQR